MSKKDLYELRELIGPVNGHLLDDQQIGSISDDSRNQLIIAGAGTGKTTTLVGKLKYLVNIEKVPACNILVISFTNNTVEELRKTVDKELENGSHIDIMTIHGLGNKVVSMTPHVGLERSKTIYGKLMHMIISDVTMAEDFIEFVKSTIRFPYTDYSLLCEPIHSYNLRLAADILAGTDLRYRYIGATYGQYGSSPAHLTIGDAEGRKKMDLYESNDRVKNISKEPSAFRTYIRDEFPDHDRLTSKEMAKKILLQWKYRIANMFGDLISHCKATGMTVGDLRKVNHSFNEGDKKESIDRRLDILGELTELYEKDYSENGFVDYDDMVIRATDKLRSGYIPKNMFYEYVLVDEYQDVTPSLVDMLYELRRCMEFDIFCVGDDWQSIYSFSGGDIKQMYDFENIWKRWGWSSIHRIETTYRLPQAIADIAGRFVMKNKKQLTKKMVSSRKGGYPFPIGLIPIEDRDEIRTGLANIMDFIPPEDSIFVIGRTKADIISLSGSNRFDVPEYKDRSEMSGTVNVCFHRRIEYEDGSTAVHDVPIRYLTAHSAKGLEADYVFLLADREKKCFPLNINDDLSSLFPSLDEDIATPEERRLFYVAMTRARKGLFIVNMTSGMNIFDCDSPFLREIIEENRKRFEKTTPSCPNCHGPMRLMCEDGDIWYSCAHPDRCRDGGRRTTEGLFIDI